MMTLPNRLRELPARPRPGLSRVRIAAAAAAVAALHIACSSDKAGFSARPLLAKNLRLPEPLPLEGNRLPLLSDGALRVQNTLAALERFDRAGRNRKLQEVYFELPESDINQYLAYSLRTTPRPGIEAAKVKLQEHNRVSASLVLNFDLIADWAPLISSLLHLSGKRVLDVEIVFTVQDSAVTLRFADEEQNGAMVRQTLQTLLHVLALQQPERYDISKPIPLPYGLQRLWTSPGMVAGGT
jgi:hypothetical protein